MKIENSWYVYTGLYLTRNSLLSSLQDLSGFWRNSVIEKIEQKIIQKFMDEDHKFGVLCGIWVGIKQGDKE